MKNARICPKAFGLALGVLWGLSVLLIGLMAHHLMYGVHFVEAVGTLYIGYAPSILGSILGAIMGFIDAFISGYLLAWLYNWFADCQNKKSKK